MQFFSKIRYSHDSLNVPVVVQVSALAIILIRVVDFLMVFNLLGVEGMVAFVLHIAETWTLTLVCLASLAMVFGEIWSAFSLLKGRIAARWIYLFIQIASTSYLCVVSLNEGYPELFSITGGSKEEIFRSLVIQKLPDLLMLSLLFIPAASRRFFRPQ